MAIQKNSLDPKSQMLIDQVNQLLVQKVGRSFQPALDFLRLEMSERVSSASGEAREELRKLLAALDKIMVEAPRNFPGMLEEELRKATKGDDPLTSTSQLLSSLSLVDEETLEEEIGIKELITRLREACGPELSALDKRMGLLLGQPDMRDSENPVGPDALCAAIRRAMNAAGTPTEKRALYRYFHPHIKAPILEAYRDVNEFLAKAGVLPVIQSEKTRPSSAPQRPITPGATVTPPAPQGPATPPPPPPH